MKKSEALALQTSLEKELSADLREEVEFSLSLCGALKISLSSGYITFGRDLKNVEWVKWNGWHDDLIDTIGKAHSFFKRKEKDIYELMWTYVHYRALEE